MRLSERGRSKRISITTQRSSGSTTRFASTVNDRIRCRASRTIRDSDSHNPVAQPSLQRIGRVHREHDVMTHFSPLVEPNYQGSPPPVIAAPEVHMMKKRSASARIKALFSKSTFHCLLSVGSANTERPRIRKFCRSRKWPDRDGAIMLMFSIFQSYYAEYLL